jgi:hypothetical protein
MFAVSEVLPIFAWGLFHWQQFLIDTIWQKVLKFSFYSFFPPNCGSSCDLALSSNLVSSVI